jgi:hypothetical protein
MTTERGDTMPITPDPAPEPEPETEKPEGDVDDLPRPAHRAGGHTL